MSETQKYLLLFILVALISLPLSIWNASAMAGTPDEQGAINVIDLRSEQRQNEGYFFALTRYVMASSLPTYAKPFLFVFSFGLDIGMLPFALVGEAIDQANESAK